MERQQQCRDLRNQVVKISRWSAGRAIGLGIGYSNTYQNKLCENLPMEIQGKTVLVTGASSGIGSAIAKAMAQAGAAVVLLIARSENDLKKIAAEIGTSGGNARIYPVDLSNPDQVTVIARRRGFDLGIARHRATRSKSTIR